MHEQMVTFNCFGTRERAMVIGTAGASRLKLVVAGDGGYTCLTLPSRSLQRLTCDVCGAPVIASYRDRCPQHEPGYAY